MLQEGDYEKWLRGSGRRRAVYYGINVVVLAVLIVGMAYALIRLNATPSITNNSPSTPNAPSGSTSGAAGSIYTYTISNTDPDGDQIKYTFDWGDGTTTDTTYVDSGISASVSHVWATLGTYTVKVRTTDNNGATSSWSAVLTVTIAAVTNNPPAAPSVSSGPTPGTTGTSYTYSTSATDPDGDQVKYTFDWGDLTTSDTAFVDSGTSAGASHSWSSAGSYSVRARATDNNNATSSWSTVLTVTITTSVTNNPPATPSTPTGTTSGTTGSSYSYSTSATDPDGDQVKYTFDWGDNTTPTETLFFASGASASASHSWSSAGTYQVKAMATDNNSATSSWSTVLTVTITSGGTDPSRYHFETNAQGWIARATPDKAITAVAQTTTQAKNGSGSLQCTVALVRTVIPSGDTQHKGEAYLGTPLSPAVNLNGVQISCWVKVGSWAVDASYPNGIQLFVKDSSWRGWYSSWNNIGSDNVDAWMQITATVTNTAPPGGWMAPGFDPTNIVEVGVKIGTSESVSDGATFNGNMYADSFDWP